MITAMTRMRPRVCARTTQLSAEGYFTLYVDHPHRLYGRLDEVTKLSKTKSSHGASPISAKDHMCDVSPFHVLLFLYFALIQALEIFTPSRVPPSLCVLLRSWILLAMTHNPIVLTPSNVERRDDGIPYVGATIPQEEARVNLNESRDEYGLCTTRP